MPQGNGVAAGRCKVTAGLAVDSRDARDVLDQIKDAYGADYDIGLAAGWYCAYRLTGGPLLTAATPGELAAAIWDDRTGR